MACMLVLALLAACTAGTVLGQLPGMPMPEVCSGPAEAPMPRTDLNWPANQTKLANELHQLDQSKGVDLIFYGDSITWCFTGENPTGVALAADKERAAVFQRHFGRYRSKIMAIPGDQSANLEWRIMDGGEFPTIHMPKTVVILIGTNDLTYADCHDDQMEILNAARGVIDRVTQLTQYIRSMSPRTKIVLLGLLPRGAQYWDKDQAYIWPNRYQAAIAAVNAGYYNLAQSDAHIKYRYCGQPYTSGFGINSNLLYDGIHPNAQGLELLASCIQQDVEQDMQYDAS